MRLGLVGCGRVVERCQLPIYLAARERLRVVALTDPDPHRRGAMGEALGVPVASRCAGLDELMARRDLDAVVVSSPPASHAEAVAAAFERGLAAICEKPLCRDLAELTRLEGALAGRRGFVAVLHNYLFDPGWRGLIAAVRGGAIGRPVLLRLHELAFGHWPDCSPPGTSWRRSTAHGGGPLRDNLYHGCYLAEAVVGRPVIEGHALTGDLLLGYEAGDTALVHLRHEDGALTQLTGSWAFRGVPSAAVEVAGETAMLRYRHWQQPPVLVREGPEGEAELPLDAAEERDAFGFRPALLAALEACARGEPPPHGIADARRVLEVLALLAPGEATVRAAS